MSDTLPKQKITRWVLFCIGMVLFGTNTLMAQGNPTIYQEPEDSLFIGIFLQIILPILLLLVLVAPIFFGIRHLRRKAKAKVKKPPAA